MCTKGYKFCKHKMRGCHYFQILLFRYSVVDEKREKGRGVGKRDNS